MQTASESTTTRTAQVCQPCKSRHRRCDFEEHGCSQCKSAGIECVPQPALKFRYHEKQKALSRASSNLWKPCPLPPVPVRFYDETPGVRASYQEAMSPWQSDEMAPYPADLDQYEPATDEVGNEMNGSRTARQDQDATSPSENGLSELLPLSPTEALLLRNFTDHMAQWTDIADPFRTFETDVSRLALTDPIIRSAICAFSARHFYRCHEDTDGDEEALNYQNRCLNLLIPSMSGDQRISASVLTAVALLRQNEEMDGQSNFCHVWKRLETNFSLYLGVQSCRSTS